MLYIDVGNTLMGGLRTGIQRVVRSLSYELAVNSGVETRLIAFDVGTGRYFALADPVLIRSAETLGDIGREARAYFDFDAFAKGDIFFEPDSSWTEPLNCGALFRRLKAKRVIVVVLNHDAIPILLPEVCHPNTLVSFAETIANHIQYADYALATSARVARDLCAVGERPQHFRAKAYGALGWPMRPGDWPPELEPLDPAFENYYSQNYEAAEGGMFAGLKPLGDLDAKTNRAAAALRQARRAELEGGGAHAPSPLALIVAPDGLRFVGLGTILAGRSNVRRILLLNGAGDVTLVTGRLDMFVTEPRGTPVGGESVRLGEVCWIPLLPPDKPGLYAIRFFAALDSGARLEARGLLTVVADEGRE